MIRLPNTIMPITVYGLILPPYIEFRSPYTVIIRNRFSRLWDQSFSTYALRRGEGYVCVSSGWLFYVLYVRIKKTVIKAKDII